MAFAHGDDAHAPQAPKAASSAEATTFGRPGDRASVTRHRRVAMSDEMRFTRRPVAVRKLKTVRFALANNGKVPARDGLGYTSRARGSCSTDAQVPDMEQRTVMANGKPGPRVTSYGPSTSGTLRVACLFLATRGGMVGTVVVK